MIFRLCQISAVLFVANANAGADYDAFEASLDETRGETIILRPDEGVDLSRSNSPDDAALTGTFSISSEVSDLTGTSASRISPATDDVVVESTDERTYFESTSALKDAEVEHRQQAIDSSLDVSADEDHMLASVTTSSTNLYAAISTATAADAVYSVPEETPAARQSLKHILAEKIDLEFRDGATLEEIIRQVMPADWDVFADFGSDYAHLKSKRFIVRLMGSRRTALSRLRQAVVESGDPINFIPFYNRDDHTKDAALYIVIDR